MYWRAITFRQPGRMKRWLLAAGAMFLLIWFVFLDSHSLTSRIEWHRERARLERENAVLSAQIADVEARLSRRLSDEEVERIAREEYGMSRPGEVVYRVEIDD
jgi:cell division protein FtsB